MCPELLLLSLVQPEPANKPKSQVGPGSVHHTLEVSYPGLVLSSSEGTNKVHKQATQVPRHLSLLHWHLFLDIYGLIEVFYNQLTEEENFWNLIHEWISLVCWYDMKNICSALQLLSQGAQTISLDRALGQVPVTYSVQRECKARHGLVGCDEGLIGHRTGRNNIGWLRILDGSGEEVHGWTVGVNITINGSFCPPEIHMLKPNTQCDGIWRWGLWQVIRSWSFQD